MVTWPAVIHYHGEDELIYISSLAEWLNDTDLSQDSYAVEDRLIDANGTLFALPSDDKIPNAATLVCLNTHILLVDFVDLVRKHAVLENYCCSAKINATTHQQVIAMVKEINSL